MIALRRQAALLVCAAPLTDQDHYYAALMQQFDAVIAVDDGASLCMRLGRVPDVVIGDLDSLDSATLTHLEGLGVTIERHPVDKDVSDLDLALARVRACGYRTATVTAAWSGRLDHTLAAIGSAARAADLSVDLGDPGLAGWVLDSETRPLLTVDRPHATLSIFAVLGPAVVSCQGTLYELEEATLAPLSSWGLSNVVGDSAARVSVHSGRVVVLSAVYDGCP